MSFIQNIALGLTGLNILIKGEIGTDSRAVAARQRTFEAHDRVIRDGLLCGLVMAGTTGQEKYARSNSSYKAGIHASFTPKKTCVEAHQAMP